MIVAVVLAAGRSDRFGRPKALLPCDGDTFLERILRTLRESLVDEPRIVLGHEAQRIRARLNLPPQVCVENPDHGSGMLSSVQCGIRALPQETTAFLLWPVDHPLVRADTVDRLVDAFSRRRPPIVVPLHAGRQGHPTLFRADLALDLMEAPADRGARAVVHAHDDRLGLEVEDPGVVTNINDAQAYERAFGRPLPPEAG